MSLLEDQWEMAQVVCGESPLCRRDDEAGRWVSVRKAIAVTAVGPSCQALYRNLAPGLERYAERYGWDLRVNSEIPEWFADMYSRPSWNLRSLCCAYKLYQPSLYAEYDLLAILDADMLVNPSAPCLSTYADDIPPHGFAGAQDVSFSERALFPDWREYHYDDFLPPDEVRALPFPKLHVNSGLILLKPADIKDDWMALMDMECDFCDERRINLRFTQAGKAFFLPPQWNVVYPYELVRRGRVSRRSRYRVVRKVQRVWYENYGEERKVREIFRDAYALHFASTDKEIPLRMNVRKLLSAA
jgi:hypothetical protein